MNLRINPDSIRFRVSAADFSQLCETGYLEQQTPLALHQQLQYTLKLSALPAETTCNLLHLDTMHTPSGLHVVLYISPAAQAQLNADTPSKDGIRDFKTLTDGTMLTLGLEIDIGKAKRAGS
ncbi:MAG: DUF7009 family protein [Fluviibacter sp.]